MSITNTFVSLKVNSSDPSLVSSNAWDDPLTTTDYFDLKSRGCVGEGVTDDTAAIAAAIASADAIGNSGGSNILVPCGYTFLTDRIVRTSGVPIRFFGGGTLKLRTANDALIRCENGLVVLDGVKLDGNGIALTNNACALARSITTGEIVCINRSEFLNAGTAASGISGGIASDVGGKIKVHNCVIHDVHGFGIHVQGTGKADISHNEIYNTGNSAIYVGPISNGSTACISDGYTISHNIINHVLADLGGSGQNGNGINVYRNSNGSIGDNQITDTAWSLIRISDADHVAVTGNRGTTAGETGMYAEAGCFGVSFINNIVDGTQSSGIDCTNASAGVYMLVTGNTVTNFGLSGASTSWGIAMEQGIVSSNFIDGKGNARAIWGLKIGVGAGTATNQQVQAEMNQIAGCKYDVGVGTSVIGGTQRFIISRTMDVRHDANFSSPIGGIGGANTDAGNGSTIGATVLGKIFWDRNYFDVPTAEIPGGGAPGAEIGSTMKINGAWKVWTGAAWA